MSEKIEGLRTIWYLVGIVIVIMGILVLLAGFIDVLSPSPPETVLADLHPGIWWGIIMVVTGGIFLFSNKGKVVK
jgi:hypothetical protein